MRLRSRLMLLVAATAVPLATLALVASLLLIANEQDKFVTAIKDRNRAFMSAVDNELQGHIQTLAGVSALPGFARGDLAQLHRELVAVMATQPDWIAILLSAPDGTQRLNTLVPFGTPLPAPIDAESVRLSATSQKPAVGGITSRGLVNRWGIAVRFPIVHNGETVFVLTAVLDPAIFERLIQEQKLPSGWVSGLVDASDRFIARVPPRPPGTLAGSDYRRAVADASEGWYHGVTVEGLDTFTAFKRSDFSHWSVGFAMPASVVLAGAYRLAWTMALIAFVCIAFAAGIAYWFGHNISAPIARLARAAPNLGEGDATIEADSNIVEVRELAAALNTASRAIQDKHRVAALERSVLAESDRAKDEFIAMLSHEMRNPLAAIATACALFKLAPAGSDVMAKAHGVIERQTKQLARLVEDLLDASRLAMGKASLERQDLDLAELVGVVLNTWRDSGKLAEHELAIETTPVWVNGDRVRLEQVVSNLIDNAVKFTPARGRITVSVRHEGDAAKLTVSDTGAGIASRELPHVFGLFVQGPQGLSRAQGGIGVGLAIVKRIVEMHGGEVSVQSEGLDRGTAFTVTLTALASAPSTLETTATPASSEAHLSILVVEDNADARDMISALLRMRGHAVFEASDGATAISLAEHQAIDLALIDIGLPDFDGYEVARALRDSCRRLIALTGYGQPQDRERALAAGFDAHVTKPVSTEELDRLVDAAAREIRPEDRLRSA